jgi:hypothetical protein
MIVIALLVLLAAISMIRGLVHPSDRSERVTTPAAPVNGAPSSSRGGGSGSSTWWPLVIVGLGTAAALFAATARRSRPPGPQAGTDAATIALLDASLDDLRREPDARRAVVAAYARTEGALAAHGFAREPAETPTEYLGRAREAGTDGPLARHSVTVRALGELTALAERARFSPLPIDEAMRARAIDALEELRDELRAKVDAEVDAHVDRVG